MKGAWAAARDRPRAGAGSARSELVRSHEAPQTDRTMAVRSHYKGEALGKLPPCAICAGPGEGKRAELHLPHGIRV